MAAKKSTGLGKGLGALLSEPSLIVHELNAEPMIQDRSPLIGEISISQIEVNPFNRDLILMKRRLMISHNLFKFKVSFNPSRYESFLRINISLFLENGVFKPLK